MKDLAVRQIDKKQKEIRATTVWPADVRENLLHRLLFSQRLDSRSCGWYNPARFQIGGHCSTMGP